MHLDGEFERVEEAEAAGNLARLEHRVAEVDGARAAQRVVSTHDSVVSACRTMQTRQHLRAVVVMIMPILFPFPLH